MPLPEAVRTIVAAHVRIHALNPALHHALITQVPRVERLNRIVHFRTELVRSVAAWLESRRAELYIEDLDFAAFALVHTVDALTQAAVLEKPEYLEDGSLVEKMTVMVLAYLHALAAKPLRTKR